MARSRVLRKRGQKPRDSRKQENCELVIVRIYSELQMWLKCALSDRSLRESQTQRFLYSKILEGSVKLAGTTKSDLHVADLRRMLRSSS